MNISVFAYQYDREGKYIGMSKFLRKIDEESVYFVLRRYEIPKEFIDNGWFPSEDDLIDSVYIEDIKGVENIEEEILKYIDDITILEPEWKCDIIL